MNAGSFIHELILIAVLIYETKGKGTFFVGFLGYTNPSNQKYNGNCCGSNTSSDHCVDHCQLLFDVSVKGLDGSSTEWRRPYQNPISNKDLIVFPSSYEGVINPMTFNFRKWPGNVTVSVRVMNRDVDFPTRTEEKVDDFTFNFNHIGSSVDYKYLNKSGSRKTEQSELRMIFRYECADYFYGDDCLIDCLRSVNKGLCPHTYSIQGSTDSFTDWMIKLTTQQTSRNKNCQNVNKESNTPNSNCTPTTELTTESVSMSTATTIINKTVPGTDINITSESTVNYPSLTVHYTNQVTSKRQHSKTAYSVSATDESSETAPATSETTPATSAKITTQISVISKLMSSVSSLTLPHNNKSVKNITISTKPILTNPNSSSRRFSTFSIFKTFTSSYVSPAATVNLPTTVKDVNTSDTGGPMQYWPAIVGGVLGAIALLAAVAVFMYFRRQKAILKSTQEIYNVNPKQWTLQPPQENGTSYGMTEIALETEEV